MTLGILFLKIACIIIGRRDSGRQYSMMDRVAPLGYERDLALQSSYRGQ